jgi:hypothetical protein
VALSANLFGVKGLRVPAKGLLYELRENFLNTVFLGISALLVVVMGIYY